MKHAKNVMLKLNRLFIKTIVIIILLIWEFFTLALADEFCSGV